MKKKENPFSIASRVKSFSHAFTGFKDMLLSEHNAWVHALATLLALDFAWWLEVGRAGWALIIIAIVLVWTAEAFNTVLEIMADLVVGERYSRIVRRAKDIAAAAVLIASVGAVGIGITIFGPPLYERLARFFT
ncbi:MAG: diacylglycerol kinase family protein [Candidatus Omnitrophica bacterium]|nr:diacylglycerol kinase family protein [Candidatus Omnitrophota bacterium]